MKVSIVATTRDDDHGGNQAERIQLFIDTLAEGMACGGLDAELILVEWNAVPDHPLADILSAPSRYSLPIRIIRVPERIHLEFEHSEILPLYQMIAKNSGIVRAHGTWVICTNPDVVFSRAIAEHMSAGLSAGCFYRVPREDVHCEGELPPTHDLRTVELWMRNRPTTRWDGDLWTNGLLTQACGDFTLAKMEMWDWLMGYPEYHLWSIHNDSLYLCQADSCPPSVLFGQAKAHGYRQVIWNDAASAVFHIDHRRSWATEPHLKDSYPSINTPAVGALHQKMADFVNAAHVLGPGVRPRVTFNDRNWGLSDRELEEVLL